MARVVVQFVASSNMGAVSKDIAALNAQLTALAGKIAAVGAMNPAGVKSMNKTFMDSINQIQGYSAAQMSARTVTAQLTDDINRQKVQMKDLGKVRKNLNQLTQEQMRLQNSAARITGYDPTTGRVMGQLVTPTTNFGNSAALAATKAQILGKAMESVGIQGVNAGKRMQWTGRQLSTGLTAPIVAVAAVSAKAAYDIDAAMVRLTKVYGDLGTVSEKELNGVRAATMETAEVVAKEYGIAGKATVTLAADLAAAGYKGEELQKTTREIQRISLLGELDQQKAMDATRTIQTVFKQSTDELTKSFNFLNAVENQTNTTLQDLTEVIPRTASVVKELGGSLEDSAVFTVAFKEAGIDAVQGANALRSSLGAITAPSMVAQKKLMALGIDIRRIAQENHPDNGGRGLVAMLQELGTELEGLGGLAKTEALATLFGRYQFNKMSGLLKGLSEDANDTSTQVGRAFSLMSASAEDLAKEAKEEEEAIQNSLSGRLRAAGATIMLEFAKLGKPVLALLVPIVEFFANVLSTINDLPGPLKLITGLLLGIGAAAGPIMFFRGIFKVLFFSMMRWVGSLKAGKLGTQDLLTSQSAFAAHAASVAVPTINAEAAAVTRLGAAFGSAAASAKLFAAGNSMAAGSAAAAGIRPVPTMPVPGSRMVTPRNELGHPTGPQRPQAGGAAHPGVIGVPGGSRTIATGVPSADKVDDLAKKTGLASQAASKLAGNWSAASGSILAASTVGLIFTSQSEAGWAKVLEKILAVTLVLSLFPGLVMKIVGAMALATRPAAWALMAGKIRESVVAIKALRAGTGSATAAMTALRAAMAAALGPLLLIVAGVGLAVWMWRKHKKNIEENRKETEALSKSAETLAGIVGYEYQKAGAVAIKAGEEQKKSLVDLGKEWKKTGDEAKLAAKKIKEASEGDNGDERALIMATEIGLDARAHGASAEQALQAARIALTTGGFSDEEVREMLPSAQQFKSVAHALEIELMKLGESFSKHISKGAKKGEAADQYLQDMGKKFATRLDGDKQEMFLAMDELRAELRERAADVFGEMDLSKNDKSILGDFGLMNGDKVTSDMEKLRNFFENELPRLRAIPMGEEGSLDMVEIDTLNRLQGAYDDTAKAEMRLVDAMKTALNINRESNKDIDTRAELEAHLAGETVRLTEAQGAYNFALLMAESSGKKLSDAEKLALLNTHRLRAGLDEAGAVTDEFGKSTAKASIEAQKMAEVLDEGAQSAAQYASAMRSKMGTNIESAISEMMAQFDRATEAGKQAIEDQNDIWEDGFDRRVKASDKSFDQQEERMNAAFDEEERLLDLRQDKALDDADKVRDARVKAIEDEMDKADKLDDQRKKMFEAEMTRMQRLQAQANRNIDFNVALKSGNLDEAARLSEAAYVEDTVNQMNDASAGMDTEAERRRAAGEGRIATVNTKEDARIERLKEAQRLEKKAFEDRRKIAEQELADARANQKELFEGEKAQQARRIEIRKKEYEALRAELRATTEERLKQQAIEIPTTEKGYRGLMDTLKRHFQDATGANFQETKKWNTLHENGFKQAMADTRKELRNAQAWEQVGKQSIDSMTQGMLGMSFQEFAHWMRTGEPPKDKPRTAQKPVELPNGDFKVWGGTLPARHSGGPVSGAAGSRAGRPMDAPLYPDEVPTILQKGEFVVQKKAVDKVGKGTLERINQGQTSFYHEGGLVGAVGMKIMSQFVPLANMAIEMGAARKAAELQAAGNIEAIPEALRFVTAAAKAGQYGNTNLNDAQLRNAATIMSVGRSMGASDKDLVVAIMTALQESSLLNLASRKMPLSMTLPNEGTAAGDADSVGLFQQRTSQGWGTIKELMDPKTSARKFFEVLLQQKGREDMSPAAIAQRVQRSADGSLYAKWQDEAEAIIAASAAAAGVGGEQYNKGGAYRAFGGTVTGDIQGLQVEFLNRLARWSAEMGTPYPVGSGYRSMAEQQILYNRWLARVPGQAPAAPPGRSNHNFGLASDGPRWGSRNPQKFGLHYPMSYEPWHIEPIGAKGMRVPQMAVGGHVNYDNTIANLHKNETVLTAPLSQKLNEGINKLDSSGNVQYNINVYGAGADADTVANKVMQKIQRMEQVKGPKRVIR